MIGGKDIQIAVKQPSVAMDFAARAVRDKWPNAVFEDACSGQTFSNFAEIPFAKTSELFAYRDQSAKAQWDELGADDTLIGTMLHFLCTDTEMTVVIDADSSGEVVDIVQAIRTGLRLGFFFGGLRRLAA